MAGNKQYGPVKSVKEISFDHQMTQILLSIQLTQPEEPKKIEIIYERVLWFILTTDDF